MTAEERIEQWLEEYQSIVLPGRLEELAEDLFRDTLSELNEAREALKQCKSYCAAQDKVNERLMAEHTAARDALGELVASSKCMVDAWHGPDRLRDGRLRFKFEVSLAKAEAALRGGAR